MTNVDDDFQNMINSYEEEKAKAESKKSEQKPPQSDKNKTSYFSSKCSRIAVI